MKKTDLFNSLKDEVKLIFLTYGVDTNLENISDMMDYVNGDLLLDRFLELEDIHTVITYNYLLQMKKDNSKDIKIFIEEL